MNIIERDVVLTGKEGGIPTIDLPATRLGNIEDGAKKKESPSGSDMVPLIDSQDGNEMKKIEFSKMKTALLEDVNAALNNKVNSEEFRKELAALKTGMDSYEGRIMRLEESLYNDLTQNPWAARFDGLDGFEVQGFVWNKALARLEV